MHTHTHTMHTHTHNAHTHTHTHTHIFSEAKELVQVTVQGFSRNVGVLDPDAH